MTFKIIYDYAIQKSKASTQLYKQLENLLDFYIYAIGHKSISTFIFKI